MRHLSTIVLLALCTVAQAGPITGATISEASTTITKGTVTVDAPPAEVYALLTDYAQWRKFLTDVTYVKVESGGSRDARVRMTSRALEHKVTIAFDNVPDQAIRFKLVDGPPGARAKGEYLLIAIDGGTHTRVDATLYMDVVGVAGIFITDRKIRKMRQTKLRTDLDDVARWVRLLQRAAAQP